MSTPEALLDIAHVSHRFGDRLVLDDVSLSVSSGEIVGLLGPNGSGKSTLLALVGGLLPPEAGEITVDGLRATGVGRPYRARLGFVFQEPSLDMRLTARENLSLSGRLHGLGSAALGGQVDAQLEAAGLAERADEPISKYSGGMQRRLDIGRALLHEPRLLLADEPTTGLDELSYHRTWQQLAALRAKGTTGILLTTHRPDEAERCDRLVFLDGGQVIATGTPKELCAEVQADLVFVEGDDPEVIAAAITDRLGLPSRRDGRQVVVECERGHEVIVRIVEALPGGQVRGISLRRPGLGDVFLKLTGSSLSESQDVPALTTEEAA